MSKYLRVDCAAGAILEPFIYTFQDADGNAVDLTGFSSTITWKKWSDASTGSFAATAVGDAAGTVTFSVPAAVTASADTVDLMVWAGDGTTRYDGKTWRLVVSDPPGTAPSI